MLRARSLGLFTFALTLAGCSRSETPPLPAAQPRGPSDVGPTVVTGTRPAPTTAASAAASASPSVAAPPPGEPSKRAVENANGFALSLFRSLTKAEQNVLVSGPSARQALSIVYLGAKGKTAAEMASSLSLPATPEEAAIDGFHEIKAYEAARGEAELRFANRLWTERSYRFLDTFTKQAESAFGGGFASADFRGQPEPERAAVNGWVAERTNGRIRDLLPTGSVTTDTRLIVANAVFFKAAFRTAFTEGATAPAPFAGPSGKKDVATMHQTASLPYYDGKAAQIVELPYEGSKLALLLVVPKTEKGLADIVKKLDEPAVAEMTRFLIRTRVELSLPRFTFTFQSSLVPSLQGLGMKLAFSDKADLSGLAALSEGMATAQPLGISGVFHKTFIAVDEKGTEAAAATGVVVGVKSGMPGAPVVVRVDRPFVFAIRDTETNRLLFTGQVVDPS